VIPRQQFCAHIPSELHNQSGSAKQLPHNYLSAVRLVHPATSNRYLLGPFFLRAFSSLPDTPSLDIIPHARFRNAGGGLRFRKRPKR
jgi:hypothetical protein